MAPAKWREKGLSAEKALFEFFGGNIRQSQIKREKKAGAAGGFLPVKDGNAILRFESLNVSLHF